MAIELEGLEFQIEAKSEQGVKHIDALANSLGKLKNATKALQGLDGVSDKLSKLMVSRVCLYRKARRNAGFFLCPKTKREDK